MPENRSTGRRGATPTTSTDQISASSPSELTELTGYPLRTAACRMAAILIKETEDAIYLVDEEGTWVLSRDSYMDLSDWDGGRTAPQELLAQGRPVVVTLREGSLIHEIRPWTVRKGGDPIAARKRKEMLLDILTLDGSTDAVTTGRTLGEKQLLRLEEAMGRRLGWNPDTSFGGQVFFGHHIRSASWDCGSDGGGG